MHNNTNNCKVPLAGETKQCLNNLTTMAIGDQEICSNPGICTTPVTFNAIPVYVKLKIFSYLGIIDLCRIAAVNKDWLTLSCDNVLWQKLFNRDCKTWNVIGWNSNPLLYTELHCDWTQKEIYLKCCPNVRRHQKQDSHIYLTLSSLLRSVLPKTTPRVAMFGPGLESSTSAIVRRILYEDNDTFTRVKMFPGLYGGFGSGFTLKVGTKFVDLMVLYSSTKKERTAANASVNRMQWNRLVRQSSVDVESGTVRTYELTQSVRYLCHTLDAFVYVVDADLSEGDCSNDELMAMCNERWSAVNLPVLVLSCVRDATVTRRPCIDVVKLADMSTLNRPWQVHNIDVSTLAGLAEAFTWLTEQAARS